MRPTDVRPEQGWREKVRKLRPSLILAATLIGGGAFVGGMAVKLYDRSMRLVASPEEIADLKSIESDRRAIMAMLASRPYDERITPIYERAMSANPLQDLGHARAPSKPDEMPRFIADSLANTARDAQSMLAHSRRAGGCRLMLGLTATAFTGLRRHIQEIERSGPAG